ncbi:MAG: hypothetical protein JWN48_4326 [Myxococcaceae bacterium]|nr:hypothetical protein [Myxococcaceae bacterium]
MRSSANCSRCHHSKRMAAAKRVLPNWTVQLVGAASSDLSRSPTVEGLSSLARRA